MGKRPLSVTIIAWLLIVTAAIGILSTPFETDHPFARRAMELSAVPVLVQEAIGYASLAVGLICGIFMLRGENWARVLYLGWSFVSLMPGLLSPFRAFVLPGAVILAIIAFFLLRPLANRWFGKSYFGGTTE